MNRVKRERKRSKKTRDHVDGMPSRGRGAWIFVRAFPIVVVAAALFVWLFFKNSQVAAIVGMAGAIVWLAIALSSIGAKVPPRDRVRGSAIDFGKRN